MNRILSCSAEGFTLYKVYEREYYKVHIDGNYDTPGLLAAELKKTIPEVEDAIMLQENNDNATWDGRDPNSMISFEHPAVGYDFIRTMKLQLIDGRDFSRNFPTGKEGYLLNETAAKKIGY
ncbi:MAG: hypothetical protein ABI416_05715 [Ginsengibacter sp.]